MVRRSFSSIHGDWRGVCRCTAGAVQRARSSDERALELITDPARQALLVERLTWS
ncbi:hypothetical protein AB0G06_40015 [Nonomuraea dietziae]|uniref:hypothetical protein n=1 Tax=Nonomuraea dietziae TaxID=65515 RepID=UPI0033C3D90E